MAIIESSILSESVEGGDGRGPELVLKKYILTVNLDRMR